MQLIHDLGLEKLSLEELFDKLHDTEFDDKYSNLLLYVIGSRKISTGSEDMKWVTAMVSLSLSALLSTELSTVELAHI